MNVIGITHPHYWNNAACILVDGQLVACAEEERFVRVKHAPGYIPEKAIDFCLEQADLKTADIEIVAIGWQKPPKPKSLASVAYALKSGNYNLKSFPGELLFWTNAAVTDRKLETFAKRFPNAEIKYYNHHMAHLASAVYGSSFDSGIFMTFDNRGDFESGFLGSFNKGDIEILARMPVKASLGLMYESVTGLLGFKRHSHEGKVMGLAGYGEPLEQKFCEYEGSFKVRVNHQLIERLQRGFALRQLHVRSDPTKDVRKDIAATIQRDLEEVSTNLLEDLVSLTGRKKRLVLAGGTTLNCNMNRRLVTSDLIENIFIQPAANDAGVALGAATLAAIELGDKPSIEFKHSYWGPSYFNQEIESMLKTLKVKYEYENDVEYFASEQLSKGKIVGWFRGRMEYGPRALGARSILADPSNPEMKDKINYFVKNREWWRPFAPSLLKEYTDRYLLDLEDAPFMIITSKVKEENLSEIISATHIDNTCRPQIVEKEHCPSYHTLIDNFRKITGIPAILNTSFNIRGEPIVCTARDAVRTFFSTGMDFLMLENFIVKKEG